MFRQFKLSLFRSLMGMAITALLTTAAYADGSSVSVGSNSISASATVSGISSMEMRIAGPNGYHSIQSSDTGSIMWDAPYGLTDGEYRYEVFVTVGGSSNDETDQSNDDAQLYREQGQFTVEGGVLTPKQDDTSPNGRGVQGAIESSSWLERFSRGIVDFLIPTAQAADLEASGISANIFFDDTDVGDSYDWLIQANSNTWGLWVDIDDVNFDNRRIIRIDHSFNIENTLYVDLSGDIRFADGSVFIDRSANLLGIGTITPTQELHIVSANPDILLDDTVGGDFRISNLGGEVQFVRSNHPESTSNGVILSLEDNLLGSLYPGVGIWEGDPEVPLHVGSHDGENAGLLVENNVAPTAAGDVSMFELRNTGNKIVRFTVNAGGGQSIWTFDNEPTYNPGAGINSGRFRIAKSGTGVPEFTVDGFGNGRFWGTSTAVNHINTSSRESKTDFQALDERLVLAKLMQLEVSAWRYKQEGKDARHIGPVAEDFQQVFGLGDGKHISTVDTDGVALAAIKAIKTEKDAEIAALKAEKDALKAEKDAEIKALIARLKVLEALVLPKDIAMNN